jgi:hypothetical protein
VREKNILTRIQSEIKQINPFIRSFESNILSLATSPEYNIIISDRVPSGQHEGVANRPVVTELAAILVGDENDRSITKSREIILRKQGGGLEDLPSTHTSYDPLSYVLSHMHAEKGWTYDIKKFKDSSDDSLLSTSIITPMDFYSYRNQLRDPKWLEEDRATWTIDQDVLSFGGLLSDQYWVD